MTIEGRTGVVIPVPEVDDALVTVTTRYPGAVRTGVPAHVSVLYPFLPAGEIDDRVIAELGGIFAEHPVTRIRFASCYRRGGFVALRPDPIAGLRELTDRVRRSWPRLVPYEGVHGDVEPHLTVTTGVSAETAETIENTVREQPPVLAEPTRAWLVAFTGQWVLRADLPFSGAG